MSSPRRQRKRNRRGGVFATKAAQTQQERRCLRYHVGAGPVDPARVEQAVVHVGAALAVALIPGDNRKERHGLSPSRMQWKHTAKRQCRTRRDSRRS